MKKCEIATEIDILYQIKNTGFWYALYELDIVTLKAVSVLFFYYVVVIYSKKLPYFFWCASYVWKIKQWSTRYKMLFLHYVWKKLIMYERIFFWTELNEKKIIFETWKKEALDIKCSFYIMHQINVMFFILILRIFIYLFIYSFIYLFFYLFTYLFILSLYCIKKVSHIAFKIKRKHCFFFNLL